MECIAIHCAKCWSPFMFMIVPFWPDMMLGIWFFFWKLNFYSLSTVFLLDFWSSYVIQEIHDGLDFSAADNDGGYSFGIFSVKFSTDGREVVAGSSDDSIYVYDLEANKPSLRILAHSVLLPFA